MRDWTAVVFLVLWGSRSSTGWVPAEETGGGEGGVIEVLKEKHRPEVLWLRKLQRNFFSTEAELENRGEVNSDHDPKLLSAESQKKTEAEGPERNEDVTKTPVVHSLDDTHYLLFFYLILAIYLGLVFYCCAAATTN